MKRQVKIFVFTCLILGLICMGIGVARGEATDNPHPHCHPTRHAREIQHRLERECGCREQPPCSW